MPFIILGILILLTALAIKAVPTVSRFSRTGIMVGIGFMLLGLLTSSIVTIEAGQIGVKKLFGNVQKDVLKSGFHIVNPLYEIERMDVRTQNYTMSGIQDEGKQVGDDAIRVLTADGLEVTIDLTVLYRLIPDEAPRMVKETGVDYRDKIVRPISRTRIRDNAVYYEAISLYSTKRDEFQARIFSAIEADFRKRGLFLENLLVRNITLPASVKGAIEQKIQAEQDAQKMQFVLQKERQEAERKRVEAQGISDYQRIINESLTDRQLQYEQIKAMMKIAESENAKVIMMGGRNTPVILDTKQ